MGDFRREAGRKFSGIKPVRQSRRGVLFRRAGFPGKRTAQPLHCGRRAKAAKSTNETDREIHFARKVCRKEDPDSTDECKVAEDGIVFMGDGAWGVGERPVHDAGKTWYLEKSQSIRHGMIVTLTAGSKKVTTLSHRGEVIDEVEIPVRSGR